MEHTHNAGLVVSRRALAAYGGRRSQLKEVLKDTIHLVLRASTPAFCLRFLSVGLLCLAAWGLVLERKYYIENKQKEITRGAAMRLKYPQVGSLADTTWLCYICYGSLALNVTLHPFMMRPRPSG